MFQSTGDSQHCWWCCQGHFHSTPQLIILMPHLATRGVGGIMVSIAAFQAVDPGSIPGRRSYFLLLTFIERREDPLWCTGQVAWLPYGSSSVWIRCSANAFELTIWINDHDPTTPGESCGSSSRVPLNNCLQLISQLACLRCKDKDWQNLGAW